MKKFKKGDEVVLLENDDTDFIIGSIGQITKVYSDEEVEVYFSNQYFPNGYEYSCEQSISSIYLVHSEVYNSPLAKALR